MATKQAIGPNQEAWLTKMESGDVKQLRRKLIRADRSESCCLGLGCLLAERELQLECKADGAFASFASPGGYSSDQLPPDSVAKWLRLKDRNGRFIGALAIYGESCLSAANDAGATFPQIAAFIRAHPEAVFTEPA